MILGVFLAVIGSISVNFGYNLQRFSIVNRKESIWYFGLLIYVLGNFFGFLAMKFASASVVTVMSGVGLAANAIFAWKLNSEQIGETDLLGISLILIGSIGVASFSRKNRVFEPEELLELLLNKRTISLFLLLIVCFCLVHYYSKTSTFIVLDEDEESLVVPPPVLRSQRTTLGVAYVLMAAILASMGTILSKLTSVLLFRWTAFPVIITNLLITLGQIRVSNAALKITDALFFVPMFHTGWTIITVVCDRVLIGENIGLGFYCSLSLTLIGALCLGFRIFKREINFVDTRIICY